MNADTAKGPGFFRRTLLNYRTETGQSLGLWLFLALINLITQMIFRRDLAPGEFGTLNTALGMIGLMTVPLLALNQAFTHYLMRPRAAGPDARLDSLRATAPIATETLAWIWGALSILLIFLLLPLLHLPRFSLELFIVLNVLINLGGLVSWTKCQAGNQLRFWAWLVAIAALARVFVTIGLAWQAPWAEAGLAAFLLAGFITLAPILRSRETSTAAMRIKAFQNSIDRDFLLFAGATFSVLLGLFLLSNADRIIAQSWFGVATNNNMGLVNWGVFDAYQTAGLLGRSLIWGAQPLLWILFAQRSRLDKTTAASLTFFWIHLGVLVLGAILLDFFASPLSRLFCGDNYQSTAIFIPSFAAVMVLLGLLQALGIFCLASRRYHECFVLGGCAVGYTLLLAYMFGSGLVSLMMVLFVGVVRWGRKQP
jgi:O-antigen/teichoic acid export membrane protein